MEQKVKARWDLLIWAATAEEVDVMTYGLEAHPDGDWKQVSEQEHFAAAMRHIYKWRRARGRGVSTVDKDSGLDHLAHARTRLAMARWCYNKGTL